MEWDWMSPMMAEETESEWDLNRLTESLLRYMTRIESQHEGESPWRHNVSIRDEDWERMMRDVVDPHLRRTRRVVRLPVILGLFSRLLRYIIMTKYIKYLILVTYGHRRQRIY